MTCLNYILMSSSKIIFYYPIAFKIVETNASNLGYGGILEQKKEQIVAFASKHWNST